MFKILQKLFKIPDNNGSSSIRKHSKTGQERNQKLFANYQIFFEMNEKLLIIFFKFLKSL